MRRIVREVVQTVTVERWIVEEVPSQEVPPVLPPTDPSEPLASPKPKPRRPRKPSTARRKKTKR